MACSGDDPGAGPAAPDQTGATEAADLIDVLEDGRSRFLALVAPIRPELLRYCARMTGSVANGEDVVQDTLARGCFELSQLRELPPLRPWLFRIAHNRAIDHWRRESLRATTADLDTVEVAGPADLEPDAVAARREAVQAAMSRFVALAPAQRGCVILKDVLDHSLEEIAAELDLSVPAVKAALHRGRTALRRSRAVPATTARPAADAAAQRRYAALFNAHDWDGVRSLLADDVRLDLVSRRKAAGRRDVGSYLGNYERVDGWHLVPARFDGRDVLAVLADATAQRPLYVIELEWLGGRVVAIRDYRYVPYIAQEGEFDMETR